MTFKSIGTASLTVPEAGQRKPAFSTTEQLFLYAGIDSKHAASQSAVGTSSLSDSSPAAQNDICALHRAFNVARV